MRFLEQNNGTLSKRAKEKEFSKLTDEEVSAIENCQSVENVQVGLFATFLPSYFATTYQK